MSSIDERIVRMRFDNRDFESNAEHTMSTLEKLKEKLHFTKSEEGINNLKHAFSGFDFGGIESGIDSINDKFSVLGIAGMEVIRRLTNAAIDMGTQLVKSFAFDPPMDGFNEYEIKMGSIQTILMGAHTKDGLPVTLDMVNQKLNELNTYADKTIYSFSDMTSNIGKFTNAGVDLDTAVAAIQGISNAAALAGSNSQQASHAMYNFAQALSSGSVKLIDWKSIQNAQMDTIEFKQALIDTGEELGTLVKEGDQWVTTTVDMKGDISEAFDATSMFNESLSHQWMTTEVLTKTLARYSDETDELGKKASKAATQVKTFSQLKDTVKESLGSGWAQTWEYIIGDFEEARDMWTNLNTIISGVIDPIADARNEMFKFWHDNGGRDAMLQAFGALWEKLSAIGKEIKNIISTPFEASFGKFDGARLIEITESVRDFIKSLVPSEELTRLFQTTIFTVFQLLKDGISIIQRAATFVGMFWEAIEPGRTLLYQIVRDGEEVIIMISQIIDKIGESFSDNGGLQALANGLANLFNGVMQVIKPVSDAVYEFFENVLESPFAQKAGEFLADLAKKFEDFTESIDFAAIAESVSSALSTVWDVISRIAEGIGGFASGVWDFVSGLLGIGEGAETTGERIDSLKSFIDNLKQTLHDIRQNAIQWFLEHAPTEMIDDVSTAIDKLNGFLNPLKERIKAIKDSLEDGSWYSKLKDWLKEIVDSVNDLRQTVNDFIKDHAVKAFTTVWETIAGAFNKFVDAVKAGWAFVKKVFKSLFGEDLYTAVNRIFEFLTKLGGVKALFQFTDILDSISSLAEGLDKLKTNLEKASINLTKSFLAPMKAFASKTKSEAIRNIAISIGILAGSLIALSFVEFDKIQNGIIAVGELLAMLVGFYAALELVSRAFNGGSNSSGLLGALFGRSAASSLKTNSTGFLLLAASVLMLSFSLAKLADIPFLDIQKGILSIVEILAALALFSKVTKDIKMGAIDIGAIGIAVDLLSQAIAKIGSLDFESWLLGLGGLALVFIELSAFLHDMEGISTKGFGGIVVLAAGIRVMVLSVSALAQLDLMGLLQGLGGLGVMLIELYAFCKSMEDISTKGFGGLIVLAAGLRVLTTSVTALASLDFESFLQGIGGVAILLIELSAFLHDMEGVSGMSIVAAAALIVLAAALRVMVGAVETLGGMSTGSMIQGLVGVAAEMLIFAAACKLMDDVSPMILVSAAAMIVMAGAILLLIPAIKLLGGMDFMSLVQGIGAVAAIFVIFGAAGAILGKLAGDMLLAGLAMAAMAASVWLIVPPLLILGTMPLENLGVAILALAGVFAVFGVAGAILGTIAPFLFAAAGGILAMSAAAAVAGGALLIVAAGIAALGKAIMIAMDAILALLQSILGGLPFIGEDIDNWFSERRASLKNSMDPSEAKQTGEDWTQGLGEGISTGADTVENALGEVTATAKDTLSGASKDSEAAGVDYASMFGNGFQQYGLGDVISGDMGDMGSMVEGMMGDSGLSSGLSFGEGFEDSDLSGMMQNMMSELGMDSGLSFSEGLTSSDPAGSADSMIDAVWDKTAERLNEGYLAGEATGKELLEGMSDGASIGAPGFYHVVGDTITYITESQLEAMHESGEITGEQYTRAMADRIDSGYGLVIGSAQNVADGLAGIDMANPASLLGDDFTNALSDYGFDVENVTASWGDSAAAGLDSASFGFEDGANTNLDAYLDALHNGEGDSEDAGADVAEAATSAMSDYETDAYDAGQNIGYGLADGISSTSSYVENAAADLARDALNSMRNELNEASPSKETRKYGKFGGIGLGLGFKDTTKYVKTQASNLADKGLYAMQSIMERLRDSLDFDANIDPTIRPVLDLQQIQNGVRTIGNLFGSQDIGFGTYAFEGIRNVTSAADRAPVGDRSVVNAIGELQGEISTLKTAMEQMTFEADGKEIGHVAYREIDRRLGNTVVRNRREGRG